jgi:hypothetical protein
VVQHNGVSLSRIIALQGLKIDITGVVFGYQKIKYTLQINGAITFLVNASSITLCSQQCFFVPFDCHAKKVAHKNCSKFKINRV